ncbi:MAG TPA: PIN domain-containing protein [Verrucomicrobiae bacterium]
MKLYLDVCCWNRPFDDQSQTRVRLEAEAVLSILQMAGSGELEIVGSDIIDDELLQMADKERREKVELLLALASSQVALTSAIEQRATELQKWNISSFDALHLASAENARADYLLTTDDDLLRRAKRADLKVKIENPAKWLIQQATDEN